MDEKKIKQMTLLLLRDDTFARAYVRCLGTHNQGERETCTVEKKNVGSDELANIQNDFSGAYGNILYLYLYLTYSVRSTLRYKIKWF